MRVRVFISYSHHDKNYLKEDSLYGFLAGLNEELEVDFWWDHSILAGDNWDAEIKTQITEANIALVLVSQMFLDSPYCRNVEVAGFLRQSRESGLIIIPIILSACDWQQHEWLRATQFLPTGNRTIEEHYTDRGRRKRLFNEIRKNLRTQIERVLQSSQTPSGRAIPDAPCADLQPVSVDSAGEYARAGRAEPARSQWSAQEAAVNIAGAPREEGPAKADTSLAEAGIKAELSGWVERIFTVQSQELGGFDGSLFEFSGSAQVWTSAQCLTAVFSTKDAIARSRQARFALEYIQKAQSDDGGWAYSDAPEETVTDVCCWVIIAYALASEAGIWGKSKMPAASKRTVERAVQHILSRRCADGGWCPTSQVLPHNTRVYTTMLAVWSLYCAKNMPVLGATRLYDRDITLAINWLLDHRRNDLGWVPNPNRLHQKDKHPGLNAQVLFVLLQVESCFPFLRNIPAYKNAKSEFLECGWQACDFFQNTSLRAEDQWLEGTSFRLEGSTFLWCPWALVVFHALSTHAGLSEQDRKCAAGLRLQAITKIQENGDDIGTSGTWELAETLFCLAYALK